MTSFVPLYTSHPLGCMQEGMGRVEVNRVSERGVGGRTSVPPFPVDTSALYSPFPTSSLSLFLPRIWYVYSLPPASILHIGGLGRRVVRTAFHCYPLTA